MNPVRNVCSILTYSKAKVVLGYILGILKIYGNVLRNIMIKCQSILNTEVHMNLFIMKRVLINMTQGRENYILNQVGVNDFSNRD